MVKIFRKSFSVSDFWVSSHEKLSDFYASSWQRGESAVPLLLVRLVLGVLALALLVWSVAAAPTPHWLLYLTNWGLVLIAGMSVSGLIVSFCAVTKALPEEGVPPWYVSMYWFMYNLTVPMAIVITLLYWVLLFSPDIVDVHDSYFWLEVFSHGFNAVMVMVEVVMSRTPFYFAHIYQPMGLGLWYAAFTGIYYVCGGTDLEGNRYIYEVLDWSYPGQTFALVAASTAGMVVVYSGIWCVSFGRDKISAALVRTTSHALPYIPSEANFA